MIASARAQRAWRTQVRNEARHERARARRLRDRAGSAREILLASRWSLWSYGVLPEPPATFPVTWTVQPGIEEVLRDVGRLCDEVAVEAAERAPVVRALCEVTRERLARRDGDMSLALGLMARMLDITEQSLVGDDADMVLFGSACRRCAASCRRALVMLFVEAGD